MARVKVVGASVESGTRDWRSLRKWPMTTELTGCHEKTILT